MNTENEEKIIYCPVNGWDCPYYKEGECVMNDITGEGPLHECDDYDFWFDFFKG